MQSYQKMKNSGVAWLSDIPVDWQLKRVSVLFRQRNEKVSDKDYEPLSVTKNGIVPQLENAAKTNDGDNRKLVLKGDFVINSRSDRKGSSGLSELDGSVSLINTVLADGKLYPRYTHNLLRSYPFQEEFYRWGQGIVADLWSTNYQRMKSIQLPVPDHETQKRIADYLDKEMVRIDELIAKQQHLLRLLEEKRRAIISTAVTRGIKSDELQESSNVWISHVSRGWSVSRLKYFTNLITDGTHITPTYVAEGVPFLSIKDVSSGKIDFTNCKYISEKEHQALAKHTRIEKGDILFTRIGTLGVNVIIDTDAVFDIFVSLGLLKVIPSSINKDYLVYCMSSGYYLEYIQQVKAGGDTAAAKFNLGDVANSPIIVPPIDEQNKIVEHLNTEVAKLDKLKNKIHKQIDLLKERRTSLVASVVTGKIKV